MVGYRRLVPPDALQPKAYCTNPGLYSFLLVSTRDPSSERRNYLGDEFCLKMPDFHVTFRDILHAVNLRHGTNGFSSPPKEGLLRIFFALKNPTVLNARTWVPNASTLPLDHRSRYYTSYYTSYLINFSLDLILLYVIFSYYIFSGSFHNIIMVSIISFCLLTDLGFINSIV